MTARDAIVAALATVPGLSPTTTNPPAPAPGSAWPRWTVTNFQGGKLSYLPVPQYDVFVVLPNDVLEQTVETADGLLSTVAAALGRVGTVIDAAPVAMQLEEGTMPAIRVRVAPRRH